MLLSNAKDGYESRPIIFWNICLKGVFFKETNMLKEVTVSEKSWETLLLEGFL